MSNQPIKNQQYIFYTSLSSQSTGQWQVNPTLATGDVKVATNDGAPGNIGTLPVVDADFTKRIKVTLSASEMNGDNMTVIFSDAAGAEWDDMTVNIQPLSWLDANDDLTDATIAAIQVDTNDIQSRIPAALSGDGFIKADLKSIEDELTDGNNATLYLKQLNIINSTPSDAAIYAINNGDGAIGVYISGGSQGIYIQAAGASGTGEALYLQGANFGEGIVAFGGESSPGVLVVGGGTGNQPGLLVQSSSANGDGIRAEGSGTGKSINALQDIAVSDGNLTLAAIANAVWTNATRTLTSFGTLVADIWALAIETGYTAKQSLRLMLSALAGKLSGAATTTVTIRDVTDSKNRIIATVDSDGNRTDVTKDVSD